MIQDGSYQVQVSVASVLWILSQKPKLGTIIFNVIKVDCQIRTWDVPTGQLIDQFRTSSIPTSVSLSPNDQFLATSHVDELGIYLWSNMNSFDPKPFKPIDPTGPDSLGTIIFLSKNTL